MDEYYGSEEVFEMESIPEAEEIIKDAIDDLTSIFKGEVLKAINEARRAKEELILVNHEIEVKKEQFESIKRQIEKLKKYEAEKMPQEVMDRIARKYTGGFANGDYVFCVNKKYNSTKCTMCNGKKRVNTFVNGKEYEVRCPMCDGLGQIVSWDLGVERARVDRVDLRFCCESGRRNVWNTDCIYLQGKERAFSADRVFKNEEEANEYIKRMEEKDVN